MVIFAEGDLFQSGADILVNTVNCKGVMGAGIALEFKKRFPEMFRKYKNDCATGLYYPGGAFLYSIKKSSDDSELFENKIPNIVCNLSTKNHWRDPSRYEWVESCLKELRTLSAVPRGENALSIGMPLPGCGLGGLNPKIVCNAIKDILGDSNNNIVVYVPSLEIIK